MTTIDTLTRDQAVERMVDCQERMEQIGGKHRASKTEEVEFGQLGDEFDQLQRHVEKLDRAASIAAVARGGAGTGNLRVERPDADRPRSGQRDAAMRCIDGLVSSNQLPARAAETVEALTKTGSGLEQSWAQRVVAATGDDAYLRAFCKVMADSERGHLMWNAQEQAAFQRVQQLRGEMRSMNSTDSQGGFLAPVVIDPSIQISSAGSINSIRQIARTVQTISDSWRGIRSDGVVANWLPEEAEVSDDSPVLAEEIIPVYKAAAFVPASFEIIQDGTNFVGEVTKLLTDGLDQLTAAAFTTGSGTGEPTGIVTALAGTSSVVATATPDTLVAADLYNLQNQLPPRFQARPQWAANLTTINTARQFQTVNGSLVFPALQNDPPTLLGQPVNQISNMTAALGGGAGNNPIVIYGDWSQFVLVDRWPSMLEVVAHLFGPNRRPTGQRGFLLHSRVGSDVLVDNAFRVLTA